MSDQPQDLELLSPVERALETLFQAPAPDAPFVARLEQQLLAHRASLATQDRARGLSRRLVAGPVQRFRRHRRAAVAFAILLALAIGLGIAGPQRVWAQIQHWLGYVPGVGFVNLEEARVLATPLEITREGVTLRVEQALAQPERTLVVIRSQGLPAEEQLWPGGARQETDYHPRLRLPDGSTLASNGWTLRLGGGTLEFPPLPETVYRVSLELPHLPLVPSGAAPEDWSVPLSLRPATGELVAELFPQPYTPPDASDTHAGITLRVLSVAHSPEETVLRLQVQWLDPDWECFGCLGGDWLPVLRDDLGHAYANVIPSNTGSAVSRAVVAVPTSPDETAPTPTVSSYETTQAFAPISPSAQRLSLWLDAVELDVPAQGGFVVDLGSNPQVGDRWPLDVHLTVAGFPVHIQGARLVEETLQRRNGPMQRTVLAFDIGPVPDREDRSLRGLGLSGDPAQFSGNLGGYSWQEGLRAGLELREGASLPTGLIQIAVEGTTVLFRGPWNITWALPGAEAGGDAQSAPLTLHPAGAAQARDGLTLRVKAVTLTDRVTAVTLATEAPSAGVAFQRVLPAMPGTRPETLYLEDEAGHRYEATHDVGWQPDGQPFEIPQREEGSDTLTFQAVQPLARRLTLHVPAVELSLPGSAAFDMTLPAGIRLEARPDRPPTSQAWDVDIQVQVGDYPIHFTQARLEELNSTTLLVLTSAPFPGQQGDRWLTGLRLVRVTAPDGRAVDMESAFGSAGPMRDDDGRLKPEADGLYQAWLTFDVEDAETNTVQPGRYHIELDGIQVAMQGPWILSWSLPTP